MTSPAGRWLTATALATALLVPSAAQARTQPVLPVGESHGVRLVVERGSAVLIFTHRSAKLRERDQQDQPARRAVSPPSTSSDAPVM
jgi:hypothetical protein